jgi:hypothetical protein
MCLLLLRCQMLLISLVLRRRHVMLRCLMLLL